MISWSREAITPSVISTNSSAQWLSARTKRVPEYQSQLRHLFALLAQLQEGGLARCRLHELRDPVKHSLVLLCDVDVGVCLNIVGRSARDHVVARQRGSVVARDAIVVLLLGRRGCCGCCLCLGLKLTVLRYMVMRLLVVRLGPLTLVLLLVREDMLHLLLRLVVSRGVEVIRGVERWETFAGDG
jgi:hypothetical protein